MSGLAAALKAAERVGPGPKKLKVDMILGDDAEARAALIEQVQVIGISAVVKVLSQWAGEPISRTAVTTWLERQS